MTIGARRWWASTHHKCRCLACMLSRSKVFRTVQAAAADRERVAEDLDNARADAELVAANRPREGWRRYEPPHRWEWPGYAPDAQERRWLASLDAPPPAPGPLVRVVPRRWSGPIRAALPPPAPRDTRGRAELAAARAVERAAARKAAQLAAQAEAKEQAERWRLAKIARQEAAARAAAAEAEHINRWREAEARERARLAAIERAEDERVRGLRPTLKVAARNAEGQPERLLMENFVDRESAEECAAWYHRKRGWICRVVDPYETGEVRPDRPSPPPIADGG